ncbi:MAG: hypothetical protein HQK60_15240 [Deltaproteobacteria bacterium]|nr:hypothetical protein [Deltaproteobacteria bacterium]
MQSDDLGLLITALSKKDSGFYLVDAPDNATLGDLVVKIKAALKKEGKNSAVLDFSNRGPAESISEFVARTVEKEPGVQIWFLKNMAFPEREVTVDFLRNLNHAREAVYALNRNFVFLVYPHIAELMMKHARDLFSWIPQRYSFEGQPFTPRDLAMSLRMEEKLRFVGDKDMEYIRQLIDLFKEQLQEAAEDQELTARIKESLADLYRLAEDYEDEILLRLQLVDFYSREETKHAEALVNLADAYVLSDDEERRKEAIALYNRALETFGPERNRPECADALIGLGMANIALASGDREKNLQDCIKYLRQASRSASRNDNPTKLIFATIFMGSAYYLLSKSDENTHLQTALDCFEEGLNIQSPEDIPVLKALLKYELGKCLYEAGPGKSGEKYERARSLIEDSLTILTVDAFSEHHANGQFLLGIIYRSLPTGNAAENLKKSRAAFKAALKIYTPKNFRSAYEEVMKELKYVSVSLAPTQPNNAEGTDVPKIIYIYGLFIYDLINSVVSTITRLIRLISGRQ